jgi:hypothetical protein
VTGFAPIAASVYIQNNATDAEKYVVQQRLSKKIADSMASPYLANLHRTSVERIGAQAKAILEAPSYEYRLCRKYRPKYYGPALKAQRISDGEFVPIFFDTRRGILHTPTLNEKRFVVAKEGTTFAELGLRPVFLVSIRSPTPSQRLVSLEGSAATGGAATAVATETA